MRSGLTIWCPAGHVAYDTRPSSAQSVVCGCGAKVSLRPQVQEAYRRHAEAQPAAPASAGSGAPQPPEPAAPATAEPAKASAPTNGAEASATPELNDWPEPGPKAIPSVPPKPEGDPPPEPEVDDVDMELEHNTPAPPPAAPGGAIDHWI